MYSNPRVVLDNTDAIASKQQRKRRKRYRLCAVCSKGFWNTKPHFCPCKKVTYCTTDCQKTDWHSHKQVCPFRKLNMMHTADDLEPQSIPYRDGLRGKKSFCISGEYPMGARVFG